MDTGSATKIRLKLIHKVLPCYSKTNYRSYLTNLHENNSKSEGEWVLCSQIGFKDNRVAVINTIGQRAVANRLAFAGILTAKFAFWPIFLKVNLTIYPISYVLTYRSAHTHSTITERRTETPLSILSCS